MTKLNNKGETFLETLLAILILSLVIAGFGIVISSTVKVDKKIREQRVTFNEVTKREVGGWTVTLNNVPYMGPYLKFYTDDGGELYFYESK